jgi:hypothetical protein
MTALAGSSAQLDVPPSFNDGAIVDSGGGSPAMAQLLVRNVDEETVAWLKARAAAQGHIDRPQADFTARGAEKLASARALGADEALDHDAEDVAARTRYLTAKKGVEVVFEHVGGHRVTECDGAVAVTIGVPTGVGGSTDGGICDWLGAYSFGIPAGFNWTLFSLMITRSFKLSLQYSSDYFLKYSA